MTCLSMHADCSCEHDTLEPHLIPNEMSLRGHHQQFRVPFALINKHNYQLSIISEIFEFCAQIVLNTTHGLSTTRFQVQIRLPWQLSLQGTLSS